MSYNTTFTRFKSEGLAGLDCGQYLKIPRRDRMTTLVERYTGDLEVGQCVAMIRVPAGARIIGADLSWSGTSLSVLSVGDPFACGRLSQPIHTLVNRGQRGGVGAGWCEPYGTCGTLTKTGNVGDGCGLFYQYTCETDILVINNDAESNLNQGGWAGGAIAAKGAGALGAKWTGGSLVLKIEYLPQS